MANALRHAQGDNRVELGVLNLDRLNYGLALMNK